MRHWWNISLAAAGSLLLGGALLAQSVPPPLRVIKRADLPGKVVFEHKCAPCHGTGPGDDGSPHLPGTAALAARYKDSKPAELELRSDLNAAALGYFVRNGIGAMPGFRPSELTDAEIDELARFIAATSELNGADAD